MVAKAPGSDNGDVPVKEMQLTAVNAAIYRKHLHIQQVAVQRVTPFFKHMQTPGRIHLARMRSMHSMIPRGLCILITLKIHP